MVSRGMLALSHPASQRIFTTVPLEAGWEKGRDLTTFLSKRVSRVTFLGKPRTPGLVALGQDS